jgi:predicted dehydrogenase
LPRSGKAIPPSNFIRQAGTASCIRGAGRCKGGLMTENIARRKFLKDVAAAGAGLATGLSSGPALLAQKSPNDVIGVASIGVGTQGHRLLQAAQGVPKAEIRVICDIYQGNVARAKNLCKNPNVKFVHEWEKVLEDPDVDAVIIAAPDFWHAPMVIAAAQAKKDIYVEKGWCTKLADAKKMRAAVKDNKAVMQLGHNYNSLAPYHKAREIYRSGVLGKVPTIRTYIDRAEAAPLWKFYTDYSIHELPKDAGPNTIDWDRFLANNAPKRPFDAERFFTWRCYWDYGTGFAGDLLSHLWDGVNMVVGMGIPDSAVTQGGTYFWTGDREVPDQWNVLFDYPKHNMGLSFTCNSHSNHVGELTQILGRDMTLEVNTGACRTYSAEWKPEYRAKVAKAQAEAWQYGPDPRDVPVPPDYSFKPGELQVTSHMQDFLDCTRSRSVPRCGVDRAFEEAATILMSLEAYRKERKVRWDAVKEEYV